MSAQGEREMTLTELVGRLYEGHSARKEYEALIASQALPPEPGKLEEEAEAYAKSPGFRGLAIGSVEYGKACYLAGARSRDARIKRLEEEAEAYAAREFHGKGRAITPVEIRQAFIAGARSREALLASQGDELKKVRGTLSHAEKANAELKKVHELELFNLRVALEQVKAEREEFCKAINLGMRKLETYQGVYEGDKELRMLVAMWRALLAAGEKAGGENG